MGIDDSKFSGNVLQAVITQRRPEHIEVRVLRVLQPRSAPRKWLQSMLPNWTTRRSQPMSWWSELRCPFGDKFQLVWSAESLLRQPASRHQCGFPSDLRLR
jgi:hypothetical protein